MPRKMQRKIDSNSIHSFVWKFDCFYNKSTIFLWTLLFLSNNGGTSNTSKMILSKWKLYLVHFTVVCYNDTSKLSLLPNIKMDIELPVYSNLLVNTFKIYCSWILLLLQQAISFLKVHKFYYILVCKYY